MSSCWIISKGLLTQRVALYEHASWEVDIIDVNDLLDMETPRRQLSIQLFDSNR